MEDKLLKSRENMYRLLSHLYLLEVDAPLLLALKNMRFPKESPDEDLTEGYRLMAEYLAGNFCEATKEQETAENFCEATKEQETAGNASGADERILEELAVDYARIFLSAGVAQGKAAFPYESVYTSKRRLMVQEASSEAAALYREAGLKPREDMYRIPEDHIGLQLEYMAELCARTAEAGKAEEACARAAEVKKAEEACARAAEDGKYQLLMKRQADFLKNHLNNWVPVFAQEIIKYAGTDFYRGLAKLTRGFLALEQRLFAE